MKGERPFLTARWESLVMLNYPCPQEILEPYLPKGLELDRFEETSWVSVVAFMFRDLRVLGVRVPGHQEFEEINLRFYVKRTMDDGEVRRGVVFVKELAPRLPVAWVANFFYGEHYEALPMSHQSRNEAGSVVDTYECMHKKADFKVECCHPADLAIPETGSFEEFVVEHYWGYAKRGEKTVEYRVAHPRWWVTTDARAKVCGDLAAVYGDKFQEVLSQPPHNSLFAGGSEVAVYPGRLI